MTTLVSAVAAPDLVGSLRHTLNKRLEEVLPSPADDRDLVCLAMRESTLAPGKRIRPMLMILAARDLGYDGSELFDLGCAVEMIHSASLILDDMPCMDNAALRRGRPTIHRHFGEDVAVLAAVALLSHAFRVVASLPNVAPPLRNRLVASLADVVGTQGLVRGQYKDLREGNGARRAEDIIDTNELKTGVLFGTALEIAGLVAGASDEVRQSLRNFAVELGQAFQLYDDLQDRRDSSSTGKDTCKDDGKSTLLALLGTDEVRRRLHAHMNAANAELTHVYGPGNTISQYLGTLFHIA
ncbi:polyprenyl synthetase family protein [Pseudomonas matsuisoli]|uniref:(2E,6E)-farnesyl diphosphate synthase n=1 Tax=Pseudomonas matsuisoli TaxID=1515666 RepID=A0A917PSG5_9PSED|nr:polyprenyl synthetase family protein [Pseudomonas matsuisoli]GGJ89381.1 (2E,6E)-farnesyl diphosphate synthase [Pseudomonas matsuisoli]